MKLMPLDQFGRSLNDLRISVTDRCNFRCPYCMPAKIFGERYKFLPKDQLLNFEEITRLTKIFVGLGVSKVRLTGGEPLLRNNLTKLISQISEAALIDDLTMTTNGYLLSQHAGELKRAGLHRVTISLDAIDDQLFRRMNGLELRQEKVLEGINAAEEAGLLPIKINSVVQRGVNDQDIVALAKYFKERGHIVRFIEYMDVGTRNAWKLDEVMSADEIAATIDAVMPLEPIKANYSGEVANRYRYRDGGGEIGIIASVTKPFCGDCTRLRLSPEGKLHTCLFSNVGTDLRDPIRAGATDHDLLNIVQDLWKVRDDRYSEDRASMDEPRSGKVEMYHIGG